MQAHLALIDDPELLTAAESRIASGSSAGFAWRGAIHDQIGAIRATGQYNPTIPGAQTPIGIILGATPEQEGRSATLIGWIA